MVSIIIVHYKADEKLYKCLTSIHNNKPKNDFEVIVVDNDEELKIKDELLKKFPRVKYIKSPGDIGFGAGNNLGVKNAKGDFIVFLNPDTEIFKNTIDNLLNFLKNEKDAGIVAPLLLHTNGKPFSKQGTLLLTPLYGIFALSFINNIFPNNFISKKYWLYNWNKKNLKEVDVAPGTCFMIRKKLFDDVGGFDEKFFLYFEEFDLCKRVRETGKKIFINPESKIIHLWGQGGTDKTKGIKEIYSKSRFYYFKKNFGLANAVLVEIFANFGKKYFIFILLMIGFLSLILLN